MEKVKINNQIIAYTLKRSNRKSIAIEIGYDGSMIVRAPFKVPMDKVEELLEQKKDWICDNLAKRVKQKEQKKDQAYYLGRCLKIEVQEHKSSHLKIKAEAERLVIKKPVGFSLDVQALLEHWYKKEAMRLIAEKVEAYSQSMKVTYQKITIKDQKTRWGSCSSRGNLNFNYRLIMAPEDVLDYVVVHELAHRIHMDHSEAFWDEVESVIPEYRTYRSWLKEHGHELTV